MDFMRCHIRHMPSLAILILRCCAAATKDGSPFPAFLPTRPVAFPGELS